MSGNYRKGTALAVVAACVAMPALARDFTYAGWGGGTQEAQRDVYFGLFTADGAALKEDIYLGGWGSFETMQASGTVNWDVVNVEPAEMSRGCEEGVFQPIDYDRLGLAKSDLIKGAAQECGLGSYSWSYAVAYDMDVLAEAPTTAADMWDLAKWPGKRGLRKGAHYNLELALLVDGVAPDQIYSVLATPEGLDRAFARLDEIKSEVLWWEAGAQAVDLLASGNAVMVFAPDARITDAAQGGRGFRLAFEGGMGGIDYWVILAGSENQDEAYRFLSLTTDPVNQAAFSTRFAYGPTVVAALDAMSAEARANLAPPEIVATRLDVSTAEANAFWADHGDELNERWTVWLGQ